MVGDTDGDPVSVLRSELMPILLAYGVNEVEVAYSIGPRHVVEAMQFRDLKGCRVPRGFMPERVLGRLEACVTGLLAARRLGVGTGVMRVCFSTARVVQQHQRLDDNQGDHFEEWQM